METENKEKPATMRVRKELSDKEALALFWTVLAAWYAALYERFAKSVAKHAKINVPNLPRIDVMRVPESKNAPFARRTRIDRDTIASNVEMAKDVYSISEKSNEVEGAVSILECMAESAARSDKAADSREYRERMGITGKGNKRVLSDSLSLALGRALSTMPHFPATPTSDGPRKGGGTANIPVRMSFGESPDDVFNISLNPTRIEKLVALFAANRTPTITYDSKRLLAALSKAEVGINLDAVDFTETGASNGNGAEAPSNQ